MNLIAVLLDIGNIIFFGSSLPQLRESYKNRKTGMKGISMKFLIGYAIATACFSLAGFLCRGWATFILNAINVGIFTFQAYWKRKYRN